MTTTTTTMDQGRGTIITEAVLEALAAIGGQKQSGVGILISHHFWRKKCSMGGIPGTPTSTRMEGKNLHISSLSAGNSFGSVKRFRRRCDPSSRL
jgi:hypothetical protein